LGFSIQSQGGWQFPSPLMPVNPRCARYNSSAPPFPFAPGSRQDHEPREGLRGMNGFKLRAFNLSRPRGQKDNSTKWPGVIVRIRRVANRSQH
jgi:hypothetical protein